MEKKAKILNAYYREDYNTLVLDVVFYETDRKTTLVIPAGTTTTETATVNCQACIGKDINIDLTAEKMQDFSISSMKSQEGLGADKIVGKGTKQLQAYPFDAAVQLVKERHPEDFPEEDEDKNINEWYDFPDEKFINMK